MDFESTRHRPQSDQVQAERTQVHFPVRAADHGKGDTEQIEQENDFRPNGFETPQIQGRRQRGVRVRRSVTAQPHNLGGNRKSGKNERNSEDP